ncbi:hypothetical protein LU656_20475, partial [Pseudomonas sp. NMI1173_11]|nr:hypothetical protein [Pseudomonas sp. NMI1173_11]
MMTINKRVLVCAAPDLNFIDGSSIWAQTITLALASTQCAVVDFVAKSKPERHELFQPLIDHPNVNIIDGTHSRYWKGSSKDAPINLSCSRGKLQFSRHLQRHWTK